MATTAVCAADAAPAISSLELELAVSWIALETRIECEEDTREGRGCLNRGSGIEQEEEIDGVRNKNETVYRRN
jgi:hypothetical protein